MTPEEFEALQELEAALGADFNIPAAVDPWAKLDSGRRIARREWLAQPEEKRKAKEETLEALHEAFIEVGIDIEDPNQIRLVMLGVVMTWQVQEITTGQCPDSKHVLEHVADGPTRLLVALEEHCQRLGVRNAAEWSGDPDEAE